MSTTNINDHKISLERYLDIFSVFLAFGLILAYVIIAMRDNFVNPVDYQHYIWGVEGNYQEYYYAEWMLILLYPFAKMPFYLGYALWTALNIICIWYAVRVFGGKLWLVMLSYQLFWLIYYGQIVGIIAGGLAFYWKYVKDRPLLSGIGAVLAIAKPQLGLPILIGIGIVEGTSWKNRFISTIPVVLVTIISLLISPTWIIDLVYRIQNTPPDHMGSISLWNWIGAYSLIAWVAVFLPMSRMERIIMVAATSALALPYFQQSGLLVLFSLPIGYLPLLGNLGYLLAFSDDNTVLILTITPALVVYIYIAGKAVIIQSQRWMTLSRETIISNDDNR